MRAKFQAIQHFSQLVFDVCLILRRKKEGKGRGRKKEKLYASD